MGLAEVMQRMLEHVASLRQLEVDVYEFVALKALVILSPGTGNVHYYHYMGKTLIWRINNAFTA